MRPGAQAEDVGRRGPSRLSSSPARGSRADQSNAVAAVEGVVRGLGLRSRLEGATPFKESGAQVDIKGYPLHAQTVRRVYHEFAKRGYEASFELTDINKLYTPADVKGLAASGYKVAGVPSRLLIGVCGAPAASTTKEGS